MHNGIEHSIMFAAVKSVLRQRLLVRLLAIILGIKLFTTELVYKVALNAVIFHLTSKQFI